MARDLKFDWSIQATCKRSVLVNQAHLGIFPGIAARKLTNTPAVICSYPCRGRWFISKKQIIVLIESLFTATCRGSSKQVFLKCFTQSRGKQLRRSLVSISQQPATFLIKGFDMTLSCGYCETVKNTLTLLILYLQNISVAITTYNAMLISQGGFSNHLLRHS